MNCSGMNTSTCGLDYWLKISSKIVQVNLTINAYETFLSYMCQSSKGCESACWLGGPNLNYFWLKKQSQAKRMLQLEMSNLIPAIWRISQHLH